MARAFEKLHSVPDAFGDVEVSGRSDMAIFREVAKVHGAGHDDVSLSAFVDAYVPEMQIALRERSGSVMPGVIDVLDALQTRPDVVSGLGTGNFRRTGEAKLIHYELARYFPGCVGGFGDDHEERAELIRFGIERLSSGGTRADRIVIVGDTPHDVAAAKANGAFALGVATGRDSVDDLVACGADVALADLSDAEAVLRILVRD
jgi:phosphoglycolate phosphatase-like HAD superfamily hydrolase